MNDRWFYTTLMISSALVLIGMAALSSITATLSISRNNYVACVGYMQGRPVAEIKAICGELEKKE